MDSVRNKVAVVTGSSSGIGKGIALALAKRGARVVITSRTLATAARVAAEVETQGGLAFPCVYDLEQPESGQELLASVQREWKRIDIVVNNALQRTELGPRPFQEITYGQLQAAITVNLTNTMALAARAYPYLRESGGVLLNIGSVIVNRHMDGLALYAIIKGAISQATQVLAAEWARDGIRVNQINPGFVVTDSLAERVPAPVVEALRAQFLPHHPLGRLGTVDDLGELAAFLVSRQAGWMTGTIVDLDGGYSRQGISFPA